jgi:hypothetical protein
MQTILTKYFVRISTFYSSEPKAPANRAMSVVEQPHLAIGRGRPDSVVGWEPLPWEGRRQQSRRQSRARPTSHKRKPQPTSGHRTGLQPPHMPPPAQPNGSRDDPQGTGMSIPARKQNVYLSANRHDHAAQAKPSDPTTNPADYTFTNADRDQTRHLHTPTPKLSKGAHSSRAASSYDRELRPERPPLQQDPAVELCYIGG